MVFLDVIMHHHASFFCLQCVYLHKPIHYIAIVTFGLLRSRRHPMAGSTA